MCKLNIKNDRYNNKNDIFYGDYQFQDKLKEILFVIVKSKRDEKW